VFAKEDFNILPEHKQWNHTIELILGLKPKSLKVYSLSLVEQKELDSLCKKAKLQAGIKPTALCSAIDKENLIEFLLDFLHYLYNYYMVCALLSHAYHVTYHVT